MNYLYNKDGKKYAIINKIVGSTQLICKEVFINKADETEKLVNVSMLHNRTLT